MAKTLTVQVSLTQTNAYSDDSDIYPSRGTMPISLSDTLATGTGAAQADRAWYDKRTLAATSENLDLAGVLLDAFGDALTFVKVKGIYIKNCNTTTTHVLAVGGAAANQFVNWVANGSDIVNIGPEGVLFLWNPTDGYAVTAGTGDILKVDAGGNTITYEIVIIGTSA